MVSQPHRRLFVIRGKTHDPPFLYLILAATSSQSGPDIYPTTNMSNSPSNHEQCQEFT